MHGIPGPEGRGAHLKKPARALAGPGIEYKLYFKNISDSKQLIQTCFEFLEFFFSSLKKHMTYSYIWLNVYSFNKLID